jgi:hypothetical protein
VHDQIEKNNKKRTVTVRRVIILEFLKASIADLLKLNVVGREAIVVLTSSKSLKRFLGGY